MAPSRKRVLPFYPISKFGRSIQARIELPLGLLAIGTPLLRAGYDVRIVDQRTDENWRAAILDELAKEPICVGVSCMTGPQIRGGLDASQLVKEHSRAPVVWGGIHPTLLPEQTLQHPLVDLVVQGEGDETFRDLVQAMEQGAPLSGVLGIWYKADGQLRSTLPRRFVDLETLPSPAYHPRHNSKGPISPPARCPRTSRFGGRAGVKPAPTRDPSL